LMLGETNSESILRMNGVIELPIAAAKHAWENGLREKLL
jgi:hypothetical protein